MNCINWEYNYVYMKNKKENPIKKFMEEIEFNDNIAYEYQDSYSSLVIYTKHPGIWIGKYGSSVKRLKEILKEEWGHDVEVKFVEIKGDFLSQ